MLSFIRRLTNSKVGLIITFVVLIVIALAFAAGDVTGLTSTSGGIAPTSVAKVGDASISENALRERVQQDLQGYRQQQPSLDIATFIAGGGLDGALNRMVDGLAFSQFADEQGMEVSKRLVDGQIASLPAFQGADGQFSMQVYRAVLAQQQLTDAGLRQDITQNLFARQLLVPTIGASQVPEQMAIPYAALLLEKRQGTIAFIPSRAVPQGKAPTDAEIETFYKHESARYTVPERRVVRYAIVTPEMVADKAQPTDAEIAKAYADQKDRFAATEKRTLKQVIVADKNAAAQIAAKVKGGTSIDAAAQAAGLEASTITDVEKDAYAQQSSAEAADAAFSAAEGALIGPIQTPLGFAIVRVEKITKVPGKTLAEAHDTLADEVRQEKTQAALADLRATIDDSLLDGATFAEVVADKKLEAKETAPVTTQGVDPLNPESKPDPKLTQVVAAGFDAQEGDGPQIVAVGEDGGFAVAALERIVAAAPRPLAEIHDRVVEDFKADRARRAARKVASDVVAKVNKGTALAEALNATDLSLPPSQPVDATRAQLLQNPNGAPPPLALMFSMAEKKAKLLEAPQNAGWFVVYLDNIDRVDAKGHDDVIAAARADLARQVGAEYAEQFAEAVRRKVGVERNAKAIADVRNALTGAGAP
jgi:peptidyl-prolyl cis-trans isomerase D